MKQTSLQKSETGMKRRGSWPLPCFDGARRNKEGPAYHTLPRKRCRGTQNRLSRRPTGRRAVGPQRLFAGRRTPRRRETAGGKGYGISRLSATPVKRDGYGASGGIPRQRPAAGTEWYRARPPRQGVKQNTCSFSPHAEQPGRYYAGCCDGRRSPGGFSGARRGRPVCGS